MKKRLALKFDNKNRQSDEINKVITQLKIGGTTEKDANKIRERLYKSLENGCLDLSKCQISDEILSQILPLLSVLNITSLILSENLIGEDGAKALAEALKTNTSLKGLYLGGNNLGPTGAIHIAEALKINTSIKELNLNNNQIGPEGIAALAEALKTNTSIKEIHLFGNNIGPEGAKALAKALKINTSLTVLSLSSNKIGSEGAIALAKTLETNTSLTDLILFGKNLGDDLKKAIQKEIDINSEIAEFKELKENYLLKMYLDPKKLFFTHLNSDLEKLISEFLIDSHYEISKDAVSKLQTISKRKYAATRIQKIVRGHQVRINQDTNPRNIRNCLSLLIQTTTNCFTLKNTTNIKKTN